VTADADAVVAALTPYLGEGDLTCVLCDHGAARPLALDLRVRFGAVAFVGPARTVATPSGSLTPILAALADLPAGSVLVVHADAFAGAVWGGRLSARARARSAAGVIVAGRVRDVETLAADALGVAALGTAPNRSDATDAGATGVPLALGPVAVQPGDVIVTDANGVVFVPAASFDAVAANASTWIAQERAADHEASR
jgi:4-hydroxy-4-methyl-2-oxoglutarate aldolase